MKIDTRRWIRPPGPRHVDPYRASGRAAARTLFEEGVPPEAICEALTARPQRLDVDRLRQAVEAPADVTRRTEEAADFERGLLDAVAAAGGLHLGRRAPSEFDPLSSMDPTIDVRASA